ncbi:murein biosynthesis integral membrane protein MurJ [Blastococcus sp. CT_GayMR19]|uniref:murein biosynthesis integral membrane protein MurJ n=1 Tax=Blastococcus sp. CT_GayMR19 TaxID=2559608 RepID=UPI001FD76B2D|nr:murein biosynthesis integral membrane protein MurJ [Blastococcus sp. CT_GayMR19]
MTAPDDQRPLTPDRDGAGQRPPRTSGQPLPPPPYRTAPPRSTPFAPAVEPSVAEAPLVPPPHVAAPPPHVAAPPPRGRWVPAADDTQVMTSLPPVPPTHGETDEEASEREGAPGASRGILRAAGTMAIATLVSRITGLVRTMVLAAALGVGLVNDAYNTVNTLPNIVYELLLGGVLTSVVVPLLVHAQERDRDGGTAYAQRLATIGIAGLTVATGLAVLAAPLLTSLSGITGDADQVRLGTWLARILLIEIVFYGLGALAQAILNSRGIFGPPAWAPVLNNVVVIVTGGLFMAASGVGELTPATITPGQVWLLGVGTTLGIALQALVLLPLLKGAGVPVRPRWGRHATGLREAGTLGLWVLAYSAVSAVGVIVAMRIANEAGRDGGLGSSAFSYASLLFQMPYGIIGVALLTALLPRMSRAAARHDVPGVTQDLSLGTRLSALGLLPVTALLVVLGPPLGMLAFARGNTSAAEAEGIGTALAVGAFGLLPMAATLLQLRVFYAMKDARTPTLLQIAMIVVRVPLLLLVPAVVGPEHVVAGLMLVTSVTYLVGWVLGDLALRRRLGSLRTRETFGPVARMAAVSAVAGGIGWLVLNVTDDLLGAGAAGSLARVLIGTVVIGGAALAGLVVARVPEIREPLAAIRARREHG